MAPKTVKAILRVRRGTYQRFYNSNPILKDGEASVINVGSGTDDGKVKVGDGTTPWRDLPYVLGTAATIQVGSTASVEPGTPASVTNSGTVSAAIFDFKIPKGDKGTPGDDGAPGITVPDITGLNEKATAMDSDLAFIYDAAGEELKRISYDKILTRPGQTPSTAIEIPAGADLNTYIIPGFYWCSSANVPSLINGPWTTGTSLSLLVIKANNTVVIQEARRTTGVPGQSTASNLVTRFRYTDNTPQTSVWTDLGFLRDRPHLWPIGVEIDFLDTSYGQRLTGNIVAASGNTVSTVLISLGSIIDSSGWWQYGYDATKIKIGGNLYSTGTGSSLAGGSQLSFVSGTAILTTYSAVARTGTTNNAYDIWIRYTKA